MLAWILNLDFAASGTADAAVTDSGGQRLRPNDPRWTRRWRQMGSMACFGVCLWLN